ncbi:MAG: metal ABC transporter ATP-binding protein, partial [Candidatus Heimdallarchaeota archaeon]|nr:metal ABC transporter ATP-binding protein [Candidatus Heimdallarchaeota archaeon]
MNSMIDIHNITVNYKNQQALCEINLQINQGEFVGICGPNGSGKTTLLKSILGIIKPISGFVNVNGINILNKQHDKKEIGYVPQLRKISPHFPGFVIDIVSMGRTSRKKIGHWLNNYDKSIIKKAMEDAEISHLANQPIGKLSGGQLQRVMIARALAQEPNILLLDEPTSALDYRMTKNVMTLLQKLNSQNGLTIISVHHV